LSLLLTCTQACAELGGAEVFELAAVSLKLLAHAAHHHLGTWQPSPAQLDELLRGRSHAAAITALALGRLTAASADRHSRVRHCLGLVTLP
jgi:hypothetical protein